MTWTCWVEKKLMKELFWAYVGSCDLDAPRSMVASSPIWKPLLPKLNGRNSRERAKPGRRFWSPAMNFSYTQISQSLRCPRAYRYRYLDGWREKDTRAASVFGRC